MNRRTFFKTVAATITGAVAVGVAPRVVKAKSVSLSRIVNMKTWRHLWDD